MHKRNIKHPIGRSPRLLHFACIWEEAPHNAFCDLIFFNGHFICCFRESDQHAAGKDGKIRILISKDARIWNSVDLITHSGVDLRDPALSITPKGQLMLLMGGSVYKDGRCISFHPYVTYSEDGFIWKKPKKIELPSDWIWRITWHKGIGYGAAYYQTDLADPYQPWILKLFSTKDGFNYSLITEFDVSKHPSEMTLRFTDDDTMIAVLRRRGDAWLGMSSYPYVDWKWSSLGRRIGGPNFLILPGGEIWVCTRIFKKKRRRPQTALCLLKPTSLKPRLILPSGGDTASPGMVFLEDKMYISYYSSHEGKAKIYLAEIGK